MNRVFTAHTPLAPDMLMFESLSGHEQLSQLFEFRLSLLSPSQDITAEQLLGRNVTIEVETQGLGRRYLNGDVTRFALIAREGRYWRYEAILRPWTWYMTRASNCRIFQNKTALDIILEVLFYPYGNVSSWSLLNRTTETYRTWDYCVQYQETDFNFVSRMMEHEGIYYWFEHAMGKHTLILADSPGAHLVLPGHAQIPYIAPDSAVIADEEHIESWVVSKQVDTGGYVTDDYDFTKPRAKLEQRKNHPLGHANDNYKFYDWPGGYTQPTPDGERYTKVRLEELQAPHEILHGRTNVRGMAPGYHFNLYRNPRGDQNRDYLVLSVDYWWKETPYTTQDEEGTLADMAINCQPYSEQFRPPRVTPKPLTNGPQTAVVVGPAGEEIYTDGYGRVKVQFHWDREGKRDENSSCWIRVSHPWAGSNYGAIHIPRIGQEVIVDFIGGDPDYPMITGRVYNADQMPPWKLPDHKTQSGILTRSSLKGTPAHANMLRFEDRKGAEEIRMHAQRNLVTSVEHNEGHGVGNNRHTHIGNDEVLRVGHDREVTIGANHVETIGSNMVVSVGINQDLTVGAAKTETIGSVSQLTVGSQLLETVGHMASLDVGHDWRVKAGHDMVLKAGKDIGLKADMRIVVDAGMKLTLKAGGSFIEIGPDGVVIEGVLVRINCGGAAGSGSDAEPDKPDKAKDAKPKSPFARLRDEFIKGLG
jgi:type VI secretion system secreted protein VgrG